MGDFVTRFSRKSATESGRASIASFLTADPDVIRHASGPLRDA